MIQRERWEEVRRFVCRGLSIREIARRLDLDGNTVRRCIRSQGLASAVPARGDAQPLWRPALGCRVRSAGARDGCGGLPQVLEINSELSPLTKSLPVWPWQLLVTCRLFL